jgi:hypothetical protein
MPELSVTAEFFVDAVVESCRTGPSATEVSPRSSPKERRLADS